jgi:acetyl-CoA carboxylase carboxyl transferase subunit alpha
LSLDPSSASIWRGCFAFLTGDAETGLRARLRGLSSLPLLRGSGVSGEEVRLRRQLTKLSSGPSVSEDEIWRSVELARHPERPYTMDYVDRILDDWVELHGDRGRADDGAIVTGLGKLDGRTVALIGHQKGRDLKERLDRQYGMAYPEGYVKAMRVMQLADHFRFPVLTFIDTPGAYPGIAAEQHGQGGAIARSQAVMTRLTVPSIACVIGEGGSGGAVALAVADRVLMQENAIYCVISPEGCAAILWRDDGQAKKAAAAFKPDAAHSLELGVIDGIVPEPAGGAQLDYDEAARLLKSFLSESLAELSEFSGEELRRSRRAKYRAIGVYA